MDGRERTSPLEFLTVGDLLVRGATAHPERDCVVFPHTRRTYGEMLDAAVYHGRWLRSLGVGPGDRVGLYMSNCIEYVELWLGLALLGAVSVPLNARYRARELAYALVDAQLSVLITGGARDDPTDYLATIAEALPGFDGATDPMSLNLDVAPTLRTVVSFHDDARAGVLASHRLAELAAASSREDVDQNRRAVTPSSVAVMFYTSGTTAMPKGCPLTHESIVLASALMGRDRLHLKSGARYWNPLPMFHTAFTQTLICALDVGGTCLTMERFDASVALDQIENEEATDLFPAFPTVTMRLLNDATYRPERLRSVRSIYNIAAEGTLRRMQSLLPGTVQVGGYGMTESAGMATMDDIDDPLDNRVSDQGLPLPGVEVEIRDVDSGLALARGERGEIVLRGPTIFKGYWRDPQKTRDAFVDGWFRTGDLGSLSPRGGLRFEGRLKDMLKVGGENVATLEIEGYLTTHDAVSVAIVVGVPDAEYLEVPAAFVELRPGTHVSEAEILEFCRAGLARFKVPRYVRFVDEWPMSATKVKKSQLRDELCAELGLA
jgi:acyl-CoA synthetase (AMP-forming)/AMP-acid ligase II